MAAVPPKQYSLRYSFGVRSGNSGDPASLMIDVSEGKNLRCTASGDNTECSITGVPEGIYKIVDIYEGQGGLNDKIGFLMSDGSIWYVEPYDENNALVRNMEAKKANIDGFVKDVIRIEYGDENPTNYYVSTVFVMGDDSIVKYDESMFR